MKTEGKTMPTTISVEEAQTRLKELIGQLSPGEELVITDNHQPVARLVGPPPKPTRPAPGLGKGGILYMAPDFDDSIEDFFGDAGSYYSSGEP